MILCIPSEGKTLESKVSDVFARCNYFIFFNTETGDFEAVKNDFKDLQSGAGIQATQLIIEKNANIVISKSVGPNSSSILSRSKVKVYKALNSTVKDNIEKAIENKLEII